MGRPKGGGGDARERLLGAIGRGFRTGGFGGIGVDGLAREAGLTSGAFYAQFKSKTEAFTVAVTEGLRLLGAAVEAHQREHGADWLPPFVAFYLGERMALGLEEACALPSLSADAARAPADVRRAYTVELTLVVRRIAAGLTGAAREARAWQLLSVLSGAAAMARALDDPASRSAVLRAAEDLARSLG